MEKVSDRFRPAPGPGATVYNPGWCFPLTFEKRIKAALERVNKQRTGEGLREQKLIDFVQELMAESLSKRDEKAGRVI